MVAQPGSLMMTAIWKRSIDLPALNALGENSLVAHLGIVLP